MRNKKLASFLLGGSLLVIINACNIPIATSEPPQGIVDNTATPIPKNTEVKQPSITPQPKPNINKTTNGYILEDEIWEGEMFVIGDIFVEEGVTLTIKPGTTVYIAANQDIKNLMDDPFDLKTGIAQEDHTDRGVHLGEPYRDEGNHISIIVNGALVALGTPDQKITITSSSSTPTIYDWNKLRIDNGKVTYALIEYYRALDLGHNVEITNSELRHIGECGVCIYGPGLLEENHIWDAGHELIGSTGTPRIINNLFGPFPIRYAIILGGGSPIIKGNTFEGCGGAVYIIAPSSPIIEDNIYRNTPHKIHDPF